MTWKNLVMKRRSFRNLLKKQKEILLCAYDFETEGLGGKLLAAAFLTSDGIKYLCYTIEDALQFILNHPQYRYLAHNARGYEFAYLIGPLVEFFKDHENIEIKPVVQGETSIVQIILYKDGKKWIDLRDTLCLFNMKLEDVAKAFTPELPKGEPPWNKKHDNFDVTSKLWLDYLWRDCEIVLYAYQRLMNEVEELFHCPLGVTAGSTALKGFEANIPEGRSYWREGSKEKEGLYRKAYYGGLNLPGHNLGVRGKTVGLDANGAYAFQMLTHDFPIGTGIYTSTFETGGFYGLPDKPLMGIYHVMAHVPETLYQTLGFNPIPLRTSTGLIYPSGDFETYLTHIEIEYAMKKGCTFEIIEGYIWFSHENVFQAFIDRCQSLELQDGGKYKQTIKIFRNALYGKFGTQSSHLTLQFQHEVPEPPYSPALGPDMRIIDYLYETREEMDVPYMLPHWSAFITAYQRVYMMQFIEQAYAMGAKDVYCDTDSLKLDYDVANRMINEGILPIGKKYGEFKIEEVSEEFLVVAPKVYYGVDKEGKEISKCKGVPKRETTKETYLEALRGTNKAIEFDAVQSVIKLARASPGSMPIPVRRKRKITEYTKIVGWRVIDEKFYPALIPIGGSP